MNKKNKITLLLVITQISLCLGVEFQNYTSKNSISRIAIQKDTAWLATTGGLIKMRQEANGQNSWSLLI